MGPLLDGELCSFPTVVMRIGLQLRLKAPRRIAPHQAALVYALLCNAYGTRNDTKPGMPDGILLDAPDQGLRHLGPDSPLTIGLTTACPSIIHAHQTLEHLVEGLRMIGRRPTPDQRLGKYSIDSIEDLIQRKAIQTAQLARALSDDHLQEEFRTLGNDSRLTLRFVTPLRCSRPKTKKREGHAFFDETYFSATSFLSRTKRRLCNLGWPIEQKELQMSKQRSSAIVEENRLVWLDIGYGKKGGKKTLGGAVGEIVLGQVNELEKLALVLGQYCRVGEGTRFGFGHYRITELGPDRYRVQRSQSLVERAIGELTAAQSEKIATKLNLGSGILTAALQQVRCGQYDCQPHYRVRIPKHDDGFRVLSIPTARDRATQQAVLPVLADGIDGFLESSAMAYRKGFGRQQVTKRIKWATRNGFLWGVRADFLGFFDHVDHALLRRRLEAYLADPVTVDWIMDCVSAGAPTKDCGLPTGSPLSPALANLFLDQFDEQLCPNGSILMRYADDLLVLCKSKEQAASIMRRAKEEASHLLLELNHDKSQTFGAEDDFQFLGFQFFRSARADSNEASWENRCQHDEPALVHDIMWTTAKTEVKKSNSRYALPGESELDTASRQAHLIAGPDVSEVARDGNSIIFHKRVGPSDRIKVAGIRDMTIIGKPKIHFPGLDPIVNAGGTVWFLEDTGRVHAQLAPKPSSADAAGLQAQVGLSDDISRKLRICQTLIASKICNYAALWRILWTHQHASERKLQQLATKVLEADSDQELLGYEGAAAAIWYGQFSSCLGRGFEFKRRVAPDACDPVNVLLNFGQTILHRMLIHWIEHARLSPMLGIFHHNRSGHATLASDLQEPFRHLVDLVVIETTHELRQSDFLHDSDGPYPLRIRPRARTTFLTKLHRRLMQSVAGQDQHYPANYHHQMRSLARQLRRYLMCTSEELIGFWHPGSLAQLCLEKIRKRAPK